MSETTTATKPLSGRITGVHQGPVSIAAGSTVDDAEFTAAGSENPAGGLVTIEGPGVLLEGARIDAPGYRRGISAELSALGAPRSVEDLTRMRDVEVTGAMKAVVASYLWAKRCALTDAGEDGVFFGTDGYVLVEECLVTRLGTAGALVHADAFQSVGFTGLVVVKRCTVYMPHPLSAEGDHEHLSNSFVIAKGRNQFLGTMMLLENDVPGFGNWAIYWTRDQHGVSPFGGLVVRGNRFGRFHRPASSPPILSTDAPETITWAGNSYAGEPYTPPQLVGR